MKCEACSSGVRLKFYSATELWRVNLPTELWRKNPQNTQCIPACPVAPADGTGVSTR